MSIQGGIGAPVRAAKDFQPGKSQADIRSSPRSGQNDHRDSRDYGRAAPSDHRADARDYPTKTSAHNGGSAARTGGRTGFRPRGPKPEPKIIYQNFFKSVGPRTYAAQVKELANGNQALVLTEGKRDEKTGEIRKTRLYIFSEDFETYLGLLHAAEEFIRAHPLPERIQQKRKKYWASQKPGNAPKAVPAGA